MGQIAGLAVVAFPGRGHGDDVPVDVRVPRRAFDSIFKSFGHSAPYFLQTSNDALIVVILVNISIGIPFNYLVVQSGLQTIPPGSPRSGADRWGSWWKELTKVTIPFYTRRS